MALVAVALMEAVLTAAVATVEAVEAAVVEVVVKGLGVVAMEVVVEVGPEVVGKMEEVEMVEDDLVKEVEAWVGEVGMAED